MKIFLLMSLFLSCYIHSMESDKREYSDKDTTVQPAGASHALLSIAQAQPSAPPAPNHTTFVVHIDNQPHTQTQTVNTLAPHTNIQATSESHAVTITKHWQQLHNYVAPIKRSVQKEISRLSGRWYQLFHYWPRYVLGGTYGFLFYMLVKSNYAMNNQQAWSQWKHRLSLHELQQIPQSQLAKDLLNEIQRRYVNKINPTDSITPLTLFLAQLEEEQTMIARYIMITTWLSRLWLKKIFPFNNDKMEQAKNARERLHFINHIFISWAATHNIANMTTQ